MDLLGGISHDQLRIFPWVAAMAFGVVAGVWRPRRLHWTVVGSVLLFAALNAGAGVYVLNHIGDPRWSPEGDAQLTVPPLSETPLVGQFLGPLDSALAGMAGGVNDFLTFKAALPVALNFFAASGWALLVSFPFAIVAAVISFSLARRRMAEFEKYRATVDVLKEELEQVKRQVSSGNSVSGRRPEEDGGPS